MKFLDNHQIAERIKSLIGDRSVREVATGADIDPSQFNKIVKAELSITPNILEKLSKKYGWDDKFVLYGNNVPQETKPYRERLRDFKNGEHSEGIKMYEAAPVYASIKTVYHDEHEVPDYVLNIPQFRDCNYGTRASGDSMYPEIRNGDLVICKELDRNSRIIYGDIYIVHTKDGIETIKYIKADDKPGWVSLVPHNRAAGEGTPIPQKEIIKLFKVRAVFKAY